MSAPSTPREHALRVAALEALKEAVIAEYEAARTAAETAFAALYALGDRAAAISADATAEEYDDAITALPVTAVPAGPAPELVSAPDPVEAVREAVAYGLVPRPGDDPFDTVFGPILPPRGERAIDRFLAAHDAEPVRPDPVLTPDDDAPGTAIMPVADVITGAMEAIGDAS